jgi:hypothetical protein
MTVNEQIPLIRYTCDGVQTAFNFPYQAFDLDSVRVVLRSDTGALVATTRNGSGTYDFSVGGTLDPLNNRFNSATVTFNTAPPVDYLVGLFRDSDIEQALNLLSGGGFNPDSIEFQLDKMTQMIQDLQEQLNRANLQDPATLLHSTTMTFNEVAKVTGLPLATENSDAVPLSQLASLAAQGELAFNGFSQGGVPITATGVNSVDLSAFAFVPGQNALLVFVNGVLQIGNYTENEDLSITFDEDLRPGDRVDAIVLNTTTLDAVATTVYDIAFAFQGGIDDEILNLPLPRAVTLPAGAPFSRAVARAAATAETVYQIQRNGVQVGTVTWAASAQAATFSVASDVAFSAGDRIAVVGPASADSTLALPGITLAMRID